MKKFLAIALCVLMLLSVVACSNDSGTNPTATPTGTPTDNGGTTPTDTPVTTPEGGSAKGIAKEDIKVGFIHIGDTSDMGYTYNHDLGTQEMKEALGLRDDQIITKYNIAESAECETAVRELVEQGCNIIFGTSFGFEDYMLPVAEEYPDVQFCHATGYQAAGSGLSNFHNYFVSIYEARYLAGIAAGLKTETNKLGYVGAFPYAEVISGFTAFYLGAKSVNPDVTMDVMYTSEWNHPTKEAQVAQALIDGGCDVISQHSDSTAPATTAEQNGVFQVGYNSDMIPAAPNASLISARADWGIYVTYAVQCVINGEPIATDWCKGLADGAVYLSPLNEAIAAEGTAEAIQTAESELIAGTRHVFDGPLTDVEGNVVVAEGEHFDESTTQSAPYWDHILEGINILG